MRKDMKSTKVVCRGIKESSVRLYDNEGNEFKDSCYIHPTAIIYPNVKVGNNVYIGAYCIIGAPPEWKGHEQDSKGVIIGDNVRNTGHVTIDSGAIEPTRIGDNCYIMKG
jgi:UDP-N-acetylglucosamine acyltransferase